MLRFGVILVAAGSGERFGRPKALVELDGRTLLDRSAAAFLSIPNRVAVLRPSHGVELKGWTLVAGGERRRDSVANGLAALPPEVEVVLVHDAARPLVPADLIQRVLESAESHGAVVPAIPVVDTIKRVVGGKVAETLDRSSLMAVQTPQAFHRDVLERALAASPEDATDEASLVESLGEAVHVVAGSTRNIKITHPTDLEIATAFLRSGA
jgi:2-C-methyl-D-erythritol 4-phosphate cytidylyltransferase